MLDAMQNIEVITSQGLVSYSEALEFMESRVNQIIKGSKGQTLWLLEHPPIYTLGTGSDMKDLLTDKFEVHKSGRGGKVTYHGPGQRVVYLMLDLKKLYNLEKPDLHQFVADIEKWVIAALAGIGLNCFIKPGMIGVWTSKTGVDEKVAAIGLRVRKWVSFHGIAINVEPNLDHFKGIIPCGISEFGVTSLRNLGLKATMSELDQVLMTKFADIFL